MNKQEILDAINAEIKARREIARKLKLHELTIREGLLLSAYVDGLKFARDLVEKAEGGS